MASILYGQSNVESTAIMTAMYNQRMRCDGELNGNARVRVQPHV